MIVFGCNAKINVVFITSGAIVSISIQIMENDIVSIFVPYNLKEIIGHVSKTKSIFEGSTFKFKEIMQHNYYVRINNNQPHFERIDLLITKGIMVLLVTDYCSMTYSSQVFDLLVWNYCNNGINFERVMDLIHNNKTVFANGKTYYDMIIVELQKNGRSQIETRRHLNDCLRASTSSIQ